MELRIKLVSLDEAFQLPASLAYEIVVAGSTSDKDLEVLLRNEYPEGENTQYFFVHNSNVLSGTLEEYIEQRTELSTEDIFEIHVLSATQFNKPSQIEQCSSVPLFILRYNEYLCVLCSAGCLLIYKVDEQNQLNLMRNGFIVDCEPIGFKSLTDDKLLAVSAAGVGTVIDIDRFVSDQDYIPRQVFKIIAPMRIHCFDIDAEKQYLTFGCARGHLLIASLSDDLNWDKETNASPSLLNFSTCDFHNDTIRGVFFDQDPENRIFNIVSVSLDGMIVVTDYIEARKLASNFVGIAPMSADFSKRRLLIGGMCGTVKCFSVSGDSVRLLSGIKVGSRCVHMVKFASDSCNRFVSGDNKAELLFCQHSINNPLQTICIDSVVESEIKLHDRAVPTAAHYDNTVLFVGTTTNHLIAYVK